MRLLLLFCVFAAAVFSFCSATKFYDSKFDYNMMNQWLRRRYNIERKGNGGSKSDGGYGGGGYGRTDAPRTEATTRFEWTTRDNRGSGGGSGGGWG
ncbi:unnamed protein product [Caenorhabditis bovis]|uniref:Uncharacterized protein n=1 Tax=Caenorhabditis bovis TaxID=2654633 RepID=A0A8S1F6H3_9PELO|nr:unnamed protein product [Caenorhabditis bovis]